MAKPGYADIAAHFRRMIENGELRPGDLMPPMSKVQEQFGVTVTTVNRAYGMLKAEGLTTPKPGAGTVVAEKRAPTTGVARLKRLEETGRRYDYKETSTGHQATWRSCADPDVAEQLDIEIGAEVLIRWRVFRRDGKPTIVAHSVIHPRAVAVVPELERQGQLTPFWQHTYTERTGKEFHRSPERRRARHASTDELNALEIDVPEEVAVPVLELRTTFHTEDGPIEVWEDVYAPGLWQVDAD